MENNTNGQLLPSQQPQMPDAVAAFMSGTSFWSSLKASTDAERQLVYMARMQESDKLCDMVGEVIPIQHVMLHSVLLPDSESPGELSLRTVLITPGGQCYGAISNGVASSLQAMFAIFGPPPWIPPRWVKVVQRKTNKGFKVTLLECVEEPPAAKGKGGGK